MGKRTSYEPGTFSWIELSTTDPGAAKEFYGTLFGWEPVDSPIPEEAGGGVYTMCKIDGEDVAAIQEQRADQREAGIPPNWFSYITVADADQTAAQAGELGGMVHLDPFDVMENGRMAVIADPTGAVFGIWQAKDTIGATLVNDPGSLTMNELSTNDVPRATEFYEGLFGWSVEKLDTGDAPPYWSIRHEGAARGLNGGMRELAPEQQGVPPHWMPYFTVASVGDAIATATESGGSAVFGPLDIPAGRFAVLHDPQGAFFAIFEGEVDE